MGTANNTENGMFTGKKVFFQCVKSNLIDKVKRILKRLEAEIIEQCDIDDIHLVIIDHDQVFQSNERKRKMYTQLLYQSKKLKYNLDVKNDLSNEYLSNVSQNNSIQRSDSTVANFLTLAKKKGAKIKSVNEVWQWLNKYYKLLIENDEPEELVNTNLSLDKYNRIHILVIPALKIIDPLGGTRPQILENYVIDKNLWCEFKSHDSTKSIELKRISTGTSKKTRKSRDTHCGYCECCHEIYQHLHQHLASDLHKGFVGNVSNFTEIDKLVSLWPTASTFLSERKSLFEKHNLSKISLQRLPLKSFPNLSSKEEKKYENNNKPLLEIVSENHINNSEANDSSSSGDNTTASLSSSYSGSTSSSSSETSSNIEFPGNHCVSSTPICKSNKPNFLTADSISAEDNQLQISQHVNIVIENLSSQLNHDNFFDPSRHSCETQNLVPKLRNRSKLEDNSPVLSRRFDWCNKCSRNHVPIAAAHDFHCQLSPMKRPKFVEMKTDLDIETLNPVDIIPVTRVGNDIQVPCQSVMTTNEIEKADVNHKFPSTGIKVDDKIEITKQLLVNIDRINFNSRTPKDELSFISPFHQVKSKLCDKQLLVYLETIDPKLINSQLSPLGITENCDFITDSIDVSPKTLSARIEMIRLQSDLRDSPEQSKCSLYKQVENEYYKKDQLAVAIDRNCNDETNRNLPLFKINESPEIVKTTGASKILLVNIEKFDLNLTEKSIIKFNSANVENIGLNRDHEDVIDSPESSNEDDSILFDKVEHNKENNPLPPIINGNMEIKEVDNVHINLLSNTPRSIKAPRRGLVLLESLQSPTGKRKAAISANIGIINSNRYFQSNIHQIIETVRDSCEPGIYNPEILIKKLNFSSK